MLLGMGYFILTLNWIAEPFLSTFCSHAWIAPVAIFCMSVARALFWGAFSYVFAPFGARWALLLGIATAEYFRSFVLTGFPWGTIASLFVNSPLGQLLAIFGPFGLGLFIFVLVMYLIFLVETKKFSLAVGGIFVLSLLFLWGFQRQNHEVFLLTKQFY